MGVVRVKISKKKVLKRSSNGVVSRYREILGIIYSDGHSYTTRVEACLSHLKNRASCIPESHVIDSVSLFHILSFFSKGERDNGPLRTAGLFHQLW